MHCLLCHEKIPRFRYWRTKSEFCCDEHAATHRRQTLERLVGGVPAAEGSVVDPQERLAALTDSKVPPPAGERFVAQAEAALDAATALEGLSTDTADDAGNEQEARDEELESVETVWHGDDEATAADERHETAEEETEWWQAAEEQETPEPVAVTDEEELAVEGVDEEESLRNEPVSKQEFAAEESELEETEEAEDQAAYFEGTSVQHDEPFPIEIAPAVSERSEQSPAELPEPIEPSGLEDSSTSDLLELLTRESSSVSGGDSEEPQAACDEAAEAAPELESVALDSEEKTAVSEAASDELEPAAVPSLESLPGIELDLTAPEPEAPEAVDASVERTEAVAEEAPAAEPAPPVEATPAAAAPAQKAGRKAGKGAELRPLKTWDPSRPRGARKAKAGRTGDESLNRLAGQLGDRDSKLRAFGPGSEARREGKSKLVCFLPVQGGNGSSTVSLHVAEAISHHLNKRVLLADFDFHSGTLAFRLGLKPEHTFVDVFKWEQPENGAWDKVVCPWKQLDVLVAPPSNASIRPQSMDLLPEIFMSALRRYPYVIVDHPDAIYSSSRHILTMSDLVYLVCTPEITSLHLARRKVQQIRAMGVPSERLRLIVNRTGSWGSLGLEDVGKIAGVPVSWALMNDYAALRDAVWNGGLVQQGSGLAKQLRELGWSVMGVDAPVAEENAKPADVVSSHV